LATSKDVKLNQIKEHSFELYNKVVLGDISLTIAFNQMMSEKSDVKEYKGKGGKGNKTKMGLEAEMDRIYKMYKPSLSDFLKVLKKLFPFTFDKEIDNFNK
tara:strand:- start:96 stop:398 length:303 start_codon:yes stop_codon:yes gene_type:complete